MAVWDAGRVRPLCVFGRLLRAEAAAWSGGVSDCAAAGLAIKYAAPRGILLPAAVTRAQRAFWEGVSQQVGETPEWRALLEREVLDLPSVAPDSAALSRWLAVEELRHEAWMYAGGVFARR